MLTLENKKECLLNLLIYIVWNMGGNKNITDTIKEVVEPIVLGFASGELVISFLDSALHLVLQLVFSAISGILIFYINRQLKKYFDKKDKEQIRKLRKELKEEMLENGN